MSTINPLRTGGIVTGPETHLPGQQPGGAAPDVPVVSDPVPIHFITAIRRSLSHTLGAVTSLSLISPRRASVTVSLNVVQDV